MRNRVKVKRCHYIWLQSEVKRVTVLRYRVRVKWSHYNVV